MGMLVPLRQIIYMSMEKNKRIAVQKNLEGIFFVTPRDRQKKKDKYFGSSRAVEKESMNSGLSAGVDLR